MFCTGFTQTLQIFTRYLHHLAKIRLENKASKFEGITITILSTKSESFIFNGQKMEITNYGY